MCFVLTSKLFLDVRWHGTLMHVDWNWQEYFYLPDVGLAWWNDIDVVDRLLKSKHWQASLLSCWRCLDKLEYSSSWLGSTSAKVCVPSAFDTLSAMPDSLWIQTHSFYFTSHNSNTSHAKHTILLWKFAQLQILKGSFFRDPPRYGQV